MGKRLVVKRPGPTLQLAAVTDAPSARPGRPANPPAPGWLGTALLVLIILAPLPLGSNRPFWWSMAALGSAGIAIAYLWQCMAGRLTPHFRLWRIGGILIPFSAMLIYAVLQAAPSPGLTLQKLANPIWPLAQQALSTALDHSISLDPHETMTGVLRLITYGTIFYISLELGRHRAFAEKALRWLAYGGLAYAAYGLIGHIGGIERLLWIKKTAYIGYVTSTFINRNSYATFAALGLLCAAALLLDVLRARGIRPHSSRAALRTLIERLLGPGLLPLLACLVIGCALIQTGSRAGAFAASFGLIAFALGAGAARLIRWRVVTGLILIAGGLMAVLLILNGGAFVDRLDTGILKTDGNARVALYALSLEAIGNNTFLGTGLGTFPDAFALYRDAQFDTLGPIGKAHNTYLGNMLELGLPAFALMMASLTALCTVCVVGLRRRKRGRLFPVLGTAALLTVGLHSLVDFSLEIPAVAMTFATLMGICCAQSFPSLRRRRRKPKLALISAPSA